MFFLNRVDLLAHSFLLNMQTKAVFLGIQYNKTTPAHSSNFAAFDILKLGTCDFYVEF